MSIKTNPQNLTIENVVESIKSCRPSFMSLNYKDEILLENYNYILTEKAKERLDKLYTYISNGIPVLLEGETGTSKTLSSEIICKYIFEMRNKDNPSGKDINDVLNSLEDNTIINSVLNENNTENKENKKIEEKKEEIENKEILRNNKVIDKKEEKKEGVKIDNKELNINENKEITEEKGVEEKKENLDNDKLSYIKFNLSAEVKINDLMQKFMGDKTSLSGLEIVDGPFLKAFKKGIPLILDEINLAPEEVLQCIEEALDSGEINMEISGIGNVNCKKKKVFA